MTGSVHLCIIERMYQGDVPPEGSEPCSDGSSSNPGSVARNYGSAMRNPQSSAVGLPVRAEALSTAELAGWVESLAGLDARVGDVERIDQLRLLEEVKSACAAAQARVTAQFTISQFAAGKAARTRDEVARRSVCGQVALARRDSPARGGRHVGMAQALVAEMPHTLTALSHGHISEWRATLLVRETACLSREHRAMVDAELAGRLSGWGDRRVANEARGAAYRLDPRSVMNRARGAVSDRRVSIRPAPDTMSYLTGFLPVAQGVATYAALKRFADSCRADGDERGRGQIMADELVARITGHRAGSRADGSVPGTGAGPAVPTPTVSAPAACPAPAAASSVVSAAAGSVAGPACGDQPEMVMPDADLENTTAAGSGPASGPGLVAGAAGVAIDLHVVITDRALFGVDDEPGCVVGHGPVPAGWVRDLLRDADDATAVWLTRLYTDPVSGSLTTMDTHRRLFGPAARRFLLIRDQMCRTPWCDAPIRHADHVQPFTDGGPTSIGNGQSLCERCNYTKQAPGWIARARPDGGIDTVTPTGHVNASRPPALHRAPPLHRPLPTARPVTARGDPSRIPASACRVDLSSLLERRLDLHLVA